LFKFFAADFNLMNKDFQEEKERRNNTRTYFLHILAQCNGLASIRLSVRLSVPMAYSPWLTRGQHAIVVSVHYF